MEKRDEAAKNEDKYTFSDSEIGIIKAALKTKLFVKEESNEVREAKFQVMLTALSESFGIPEVKFERRDEYPKYGDYNLDTNTIMIGRFSLTSTLSVFAFALKQHKPELRDRIEGEQTFVPGIACTSFALSAFKQAAPKMFQAAADAGRLYGVDKEYTDGGKIHPLSCTCADCVSRRGSDDCGCDCGGCSDCDGDTRRERSDPFRPDVDPENRRTDRGNGPGED